MERLESSFTRALVIRRSLYNSWGEQVHRASRHVSPSALIEALEMHARPLMDSIPDENDEAYLALSDEVVRLTLQLTGADLLGPRARTNAVSKVWHLLPRLSALILLDPSLIRTLSNAAVQLETELAVRWMERLISLRPQTPEELRKVGLVVAWTLGQSHWRESAIKVWQELPKTLKSAVFGVGDDVDIESELKQSFRRPGTHIVPPKIRHVVGGFRGVKGLFLSPPHLLSNDEEIWATDGVGTFKIFADCFGAKLIRSHSTQASETSIGFQLRDKEVQRVHDGLTFQLPQFTHLRSFVSNSHFAAMTFQHHHKIWIVA